MRAFFVLLWKHLLVRKRRFIQTPVEYLSPILFFLLMFLLRDKFGSSKNFDKYNEAKITEPFTLDSTHAPITRLLYTPSTMWTDQLMDEVGAKLGLPRLDHLPVREKGYYPFTNTSFTEDYFKSMLRSDAIIIFQDENGLWPKKLDYTIRMNEDFNVDTFESFDGTHGPHEAFGMIYESFMRLQWTVDTSYLHLLTGAEINQTLTLQEFPYSRAAESTARELLCYLLNFQCPLSLMLFFVFLMARLMEEKNSGILELLRMAGVGARSVGAAHAAAALPAGLVYAAGGALLITGSADPILPHTSSCVILLMLLLHFLTVVAFVFAAAYLIDTTQHITTLAMLVFMFSWIPSRWVADMKLARSLLLLSGLMPHVPLGWCWAQIAAREKFGRGVRFSDIADSASRYHGSVLLGLVLMLIQTALYFLLAWYFAQVRPGKYGQAMPWNFLFQKQYWSNNPKVDTVPSDEIQLSNPDPQYFEPLPKGSVAGIQILDVTKRFPKHTALSNVSFDVLQGEITVLLGHNGAGKTTLMNIITGLTQPTSGRVLLPRDARLGLCPQHNLFLPSLTVLDHVMFFAMLKGDSLKQARASAKGLLLKLSLWDKAGALPEQLSGGMKRRVQLAGALAGDAGVLVLDEPTSGLDVETRRELWDILLGLRGAHTVLLATHFMEEADALGGRVCALRAGRLRAHAGAMFLKRAVGTGYRVSLTTRAAPDAAGVGALVRGAVPSATVRDQGMNTITYNLPAKECSRFPELFAKLEENRSRLGIESIGVGKSTLDDVFLKLCSDVQSTPEEDEADLATPEITYQKLTGCRLYLRQFAVLLKRQYRYKLSTIWSFLILQLILPFVVIFLMTHICNNEPKAGGNASDVAAMNLDRYAGLPDRRVLYHIQYDDVVSALRNSYKSVKFEKAADVADAVFRSAKEDILEYNKYLVGIELNDTDAKALYTTTVRHAAPAAVNLLSNALAARAAGAAVSARNRPLRDAAPAPPVPPKDAAALASWALFLGLVAASALAGDTALAGRERAAGARHAHYMCGCARALHWAAALAAHAACALPALPLPALLAALLLDRDRTIDRPDFLGAAALTLALGVPALLAPSYLLSTALAERATSALVTVAAIVFGFVTPAMQIGYEAANDTTSLVYKLLEAVSYLSPGHTLTLALYKCTKVAGANALCSLNRGLCELMPAGAMSDFAKCCESSSNPESYFSFDKQAPGHEWVVLVVQFIVYWSLLLLAEGPLVSRALEALLRARLAPPPAEQRRADADVRAEHAYVGKAVGLPKKQIAEAILCHDVHKYYPSLTNTSCYAVKGVSFSVKKGECFGLLGVNGAGKSTTFKMLAAEQRPTSGTLFANGHYHDDTTQYMRSLSYCPQFSGADEFLTGRENLELVLALRGLDAAAARQQAAFWIQEVGLEAYSGRRVSEYSGGCARRLAAAAALCARAGAALLDEPSAGADAAARRRLHRALRRARRSRALVVASHSMDEMEALCDRIGILAGGRLAALGPAPALRARHAAGHALALKLRAHDATDGGGASALSELKGALHRAFEDCVLRDEHETMLHYHVRDALRYSELFARIEALRAAHPLLEDYSVNETTLEEVFLSFARDARPANV